MNAYLENLFGLKDQVGIVIGGTGVLGAALAEGCARAGAQVVVAGRSEERGQGVVAGIEALGGKAVFLSVDSTKRESLEILREGVLRRFGKVDFLINCAGVNSPTPFLEIAEEEWNRILAANLSAIVLSCQTFIPSMLERQQGAVLNIASITSLSPLSRVFTYSASKAAVLNLTQNLGAEFAAKGVRVNALVPGFFPAEQNRKILDETRKANIFRGTPMGRFGEADELVGAALLLLSPVAGRFITGEHVTVAGGFGARYF